MKPYYDRAGIRLYCGDCREVLPTLAEKFSAVVTDPPFNVGKDYGTHKDSLSDEEYTALLWSVASTSQTQAWVTPTVQLSKFIGILGDTARPVVVRRGAQGPIRFGWSDQFLMLLVRGKPMKPFTNLWDGIRLPDEGYFYRGDNYGHPGTTAEAVMSRLVGLLVPPDGIVLEPFSGTGTTLASALKLQRKAVGVEINEPYCEIAAKRLDRELAQGDLFVKREDP